jgi:asparagine synthase (glutamine-hydrolysing)
MSTQSGILCFDGRPIAPADNRDHAERGVILTQGADGVWLGERRSPGISRRPPGLAATCDGRIDNCDDLRLRLGLAPSDAGYDADVALAAFERWGIDGLRSIVGDWSLVIWEGARRAVHLARDYMGARPLYYCVDSRAVAWSSDLAELVVRTRQTHGLSEQFAARFMALGVPSHLTPYESVYAVPPGVCVSISSAGRVAHSRFWTLDIGEIRHPDPRAYEERLRVLWRDAVRARMRTDATVWAELSGGLDSSSVVCMADLLLRQRVAPAGSIRLVSHATLESPEGDERRFIAEVERQVGACSEIVGVEASRGEADPARAWVTPYALEGVGLEMERRVRAGGGRVVLSGRTGDAIMGCQPDNSVAVFDDLARGALLTALRNVRRWSRATRKPFLEVAVRLFAPDGLAPPETGVALLASPLQALLRDVPRVELPPGLRRSKRALARMVLGYANGSRLDVPHRAPDVVYAYPFTDRPLVEFMLAIPGEQLCAPGTTRSLMRRAFAGFVPPRVLRRVSKGYYPPAAFRAARELVASMLPVHELEVVQRGWIDPDRLRSAIRALTDGGGETGGDIHCVLRLERWLQARRAVSGIPQRKEVNTNEVLHA